MIIINSPHNPTSSIMDDEEMIKLVVNYIKNKNIYLLSDEIYSDLIFKKKIITHLDNFLK